MTMRRGARAPGARFSLKDTKVDSDEELAAQRIGQLIGGRWTLERVLGVGGMAA
jgi:hypothetical protein